MDQQQTYKTIRQVTLVSAVINCLLAIIKIVIGSVGQSQALLSDGIHSLSDLISDAMVYLAAKAGGKHADEDHPYGHKRIETLAAIAIALFLLIIGAWIAYDTLHRIVAHLPADHPSHWVLVVAVISMLLNEWLYRYGMRAGNRIKSNLLRSNAWHNRSDALISLVVLVSAIGSMMGWHYLDAIAALLIALLIIKAAFGMIWDGFKELIDTGVDEATLAAIREAITGVSGVVAIHQLRTRSLAGNVFVDVHVIVTPHLSVSEGHHIGDLVHLALLKGIDSVEDVTVHVDAEDDEAAPLTLHLPDRTTLLEQVNPLWQELPCFDHIKKIQLHYLDSKIHMEVYLPMTCFNEHGDTLQQQYQNAVRDIEAISLVHLYFSAA